MKITAAILALATMVIGMPSPHGSDAPKKREEMTVNDISTILYGAWLGPSKAKREDIKREDVTVDDISAVLYGAWPGPSKAKREDVTVDDISAVLYGAWPGPSKAKRDE